VGNERPAGPDADEKYDADENLYIKSLHDFIYCGFAVFEWEKTFIRGDD
jgi:hypothetical protein